MVTATMASIAERVEALTFSEQEVSCPIDGQKFTAKVVASFTRFGSRLDLRPVGALVAPIPLPVCPQNGFVVYQESFPDAELASLRALVSTEEYLRLRREHVDRFMVAFMREKLGADDRTLGFLYLEASWEAENRQSPLVNQYRRLALDKLQAYLAKETNRTSQWWVAAIVSAEMERLLGRFEAVESRISALPEKELNALENTAVVSSFLAQIRRHARNGNSAPEEVAK